MIITLQALGLLTVLLAFLFQLLFLRAFGSSAETDAFFLSLSITQFGTNLLTGFLTDLYIPIYHDLKARDEHDAELFTSAVSSVAMIGGIVIAAVVIGTAPSIVSIFATGFGEHQITATVDILRLLALAIPFQIGVAVMTNVYQANLELKLPYIANVLQPTLQLLAVVFLVPIAGMSAVVYAVVTSVAAAYLMLSLWRARRVGFSTLWLPKHPALPELLKRNLPIRIGNIVYLLKGPLITNVLSTFPPGFLTLYQYADKILQTTFSVSNGPALQILFAKGSMLLTSFRIEEARNLLCSVLRSNTTLAISMILALSALFLPVFDVVLSAKLGVEELTQLFRIFILLIPYYGILSVEAPFVNLVFALKLGGRVMEVNAWFLLLFGAGLYLLVPAMGFFALPLVLALAQAHNATRYASIVHARLQAVDRNLISILMRMLAVIVVSVITNTVVAPTRDMALMLNLLLVGVWMIVGWGDLQFALRFLRTRGGLP
jgi:peptidoglycan biosynthesis protein MviN/MurJ (putative lipid II flippase)